MRVWVISLLQATIVCLLWIVMAIYVSPPLEVWEVVFALPFVFVVSLVIARITAN